MGTPYARASADARAASSGNKNAQTRANQTARFQLEPPVRAAQVPTAPIKLEGKCKSVRLILEQQAMLERVFSVFLVGLLEKVSHGLAR